MIGSRLMDVVDHIDHICQLAGNSQHAAIGSDLDGGFGREQSPADLDTIADLQHIPEILSRRGYVMRISHHHAWQLAKALRKLEIRINVAASALCSAQHESKS